MDPQGSAGEAARGSSRVVGLVVAGAVVTGSLALVAIAGWLLGIEALTSFVPGGSTMKMNTAVAFLAAAASLAVQALGGPKPVAFGLAGIPLFIGLATLVVQASGIDVGIDELLVHDPWTQAPEPPGRPSPVTAAALATLGATLMLSAFRRRIPGLHVVVVALLGVAWFSLLASTYKLRVLEAIPGFHSLSLITALALLASTLGAAALHPEKGLIHLLTRPGAAGASARYLLPAGAVLPIVVGWLVIRGERLGAFALEAGTALFATVTGVGLIVLAWMNARALERLDVSREAAAQTLSAELVRTKAALERATAYLESAPGAMLVTDAGHHVAVVNSEAERLFGVPRASLVGRPLTAVLSEEAPMRAGGSLLLRVGAEPTRMVETHSRMLPTAEGAVTILAIRDVTAQREAEARLAASERRFRGIFDSAFQFIGLLSPDGILLEANQTALAFAGARAADVVGKPFWETPWWAHSPEAQAPLRDAIRRAADGAFVRYEATVRGVGERVAIIDFSLKPLRDEEGNVVLLIPEGRDVTERHLAEERLRASLADKEVLLREVHHRVKNNLQVIASLLRLHAGRVEDADARAAFEDSQDRVRSIALLHEKLYRTESLGSVSLREYARELATTLLRARSAGVAHAVRVLVSGDDVHLPIDRALPCGLILNELVTNSLKHGLGPDVKDPEVRIEAHRIDTEVELVVADNGVGLPADFEARSPRRLGIQLVRTLARQLGGTLVFEAKAGTRCTLRFPAPEQSEASAA